MQDKNPIHAFLQLTPAKRKRAAAEFDRDSVADTFRPLTPSQRKLWKKAKRKPGRPRVGACRFRRPGTCVSSDPDDTEFTGMASDAFHKAIKYEFHGPEGDGDLESIKTVRWRRGFRTIDLFAGIGGIRLGFESVGGRGVFSSEWDTEAQDTYEANFGDRPAGDITKVPPDKIPDHDILLAGFPCQPFSIIGGRKGFSDTRGTLFFNIEEILRAKRPPAILLENVKQFKTHDNGRTFETVIQKLTDLGYFTHTGILNALNYGVCQKRERTLSFRPSLAA